MLAQNAGHSEQADGNFPFKKGDTMTDKQRIERLQTQVMNLEKENGKYFLEIQDLKQRLAKQTMIADQRVSQNWRGSRP